MKSDLLGEAKIIVGAICLILIVVTILGGIVSRAVFNYPLSWGVELTTILMMWVVYSVVGINYRDNTHLSINVLANILPSRVQKGLETLGDLVTAVVIIVILIHGAIAMKVNYGMTTMALDISVSVAYYLAAELGALSLLGYFVLKYVRKFRKGNAS